MTEESIMNSQIEDEEREEKMSKLTRLLKAALVVIIMLIVMVTFAFAGENTLFGNQDLDIGGFGGPEIYYTTFNGQDVALVGGQGAVVFNEKIYIGFGGYGTAPENEVDSIEPYSDAYQNLGYGGMMFGMILKNDNIVHFSTDVMVGAGAVVESYDYHFTIYDDYNRHDKSRHDAFWFVQPMARIEVNVTDWMRLDASAGYRFVKDTNESKFGISDEDASGPVIGLAFRFGSW
jgi:hypothetical protein